jgi:hypothetical protein
MWSFFIGYPGLKAESPQSIGEYIHPKPGERLFRVKGPGLETPISNPIDPGHSDFGVGSNFSQVHLIVKQKNRVPHRFVPPLSFE